MKDNPPINRADLAIALHYDGASAPRVIAKGQRDLAERIITTARDHDIPLHTDPQLANVLNQIPLGEEIPQELYVAVAEVIAFAYWLSGKNGPDQPAG